MRRNGSKKELSRGSPFSTLGVRGPFVILLLGIMGGLLVWVGAPPSESDWLGARIFVPFFIALLIAVPWALICSIIAYVRREPNRSETVMTAGPALIALLVLIAAWRHLNH